MTELLCVMSDRKQPEHNALPYARQYLTLSTWPPWTPDDLHPPAQFVVSPESRDDFSYDGYTVRALQTLPYTPVLLYGDTWFDHRCEIGYFEMTVEALPEYVDEVDAPAVGCAQALTIYGQVRSQYTQTTYSG